ALDPERSETFRALEAVYNAGKDYKNLARVVHAHLEAQGEGTDSELRSRLFVELGKIRRDRLGDREGALDAFRRATVLTPQIAQANYGVVDLLIELRRFAEPRTFLRSRIEREPLESDSYARLFDVYSEEQDSTGAWCAADVVCHLGQADERHRTFVLQHAPAS